MRSYDKIYLESAQKKLGNLLDIAVNRLNEIRRESHRETRLKYYRKRLGYTQLELADSTGISVNTIQQYEQGRININKVSGESIITLANILKCEPIDLMEPQGENE